MTTLVTVGVTATTEKGFFAVKYADKWYGFHNSVLAAGPTLEFICEEVVKDYQKFIGVPAEVMEEVFGDADPAFEKTFEISVSENPVEEVLVVRENEEELCFVYRGILYPFSAAHVNSSSKGLKQIVAEVAVHKLPFGGLTWVGYEDGRYELVTTFHVFGEEITEEVTA